MSRWKVLVAGVIMLVVGGLLLRLGATVDPDVPWPVLVAEMFVAVLLGFVLVLTGLLALVLGAWASVRDRRDRAALEAAHESLGAGLR